MFALQRVMLRLYRFTRFQYQLEVHNDVGNTSGEIVTAVTMAGVPLHPPSLSASTINHTAIQVNWTQPCKINLLLLHTVQERCWKSQRLAQGHAFIVWYLCCPVCLKESDTRDWKYLFTFTDLSLFSISLDIYFSFTRPTGRSGIFLSHSGVSRAKSDLNFHPWDHLCSDKWPLAQYHISGVITSVQRSL